jgi:hypothetical protein
MKTKRVNETIQLGDPVTYRGVVITPLFPRRQPGAEYLTLEEAIPLGLRVEEVDEAGSVPELAVHNPLEANVLLYDGEELLGAKQNRILNVTVLLAAQSRTKIPVTCVEEGRWSTRTAFFQSAPHMSYPELRRRKAEQLSAEPMARGAAQSAVWDEVRAKSARLDVDSPTLAASEIYGAREDDLETLRKRFPLETGQSGALFALGDRMCVDYVSRPEAFVRLYPKLLNGYLVDALERPDGSATTFEELAAFVRAADGATRSRRPSAGLGDDVRLRRDDLVGSGLEIGGELVQLCAFSSNGTGVTTSIARPSRRIS